MRCGQIGQHAFDDGRLFVGRLLRSTGHSGRVFNLLGHFVAGLDVVQTRIVVLQTLQLVVRGLQTFVGDEQHIGALLQLDFGNL